MSEVTRSAFSSDGYIVDQSLTKEYLYGAFASPYNGCGWIACYNLLLAAGKRVECRDVIEGLTPTLQLRGLIGTRIRHVVAYLNSWGLDILITRKRDDIFWACENSDHGIIWYWEGLEPHFVTFTRVDKDTFRFFNAIDGKENHISGIRAFVKERCFLPCIRALTVKSG